MSAGRGDQAVLAFTDVHIRRGGRDVLRVPELTLAPGETVAVLGANGAGKSTLLLASALLLPVDGGHVALFGERAGNARDAVRLRRGTSTVFQEPGLLDMTARRNVELALGLHGVPRSERRARAEGWLGRLGVGRLGGARPHTLSGGEAQRVSLARAFAVGPRLIFLDEPFSALDPASRARLVGDLAALLASEGTAALMATHDLGEARLLADRVVVLIDGHVTQVATPHELFARPANADVADFLGYAVVEAALLRSLLALDGGAPGYAFVPPTAVRVADPAGAAHGSRPLDGRIVAVLGAAGVGRVICDVGAPLAAEVPIERIRDEGLRAGEAVRVTVDAERVIWPLVAGR